MRQIINPAGGPGALGPYSPAIKCNGLVFVSGQIPLDPASGELVGGDIQAQVRRVLENIGLLLKGAGSSFQEVLKVSVFLANLDNFDAMNQVYAEYFGDSRPARSTIEVSRLPKGVDVEIDVIAACQK